MTFANQVAIITGASSGIGRELALQLARRQARVGVLARRRDRLEALVAEIQAAGGQAAWATADVGDRAQTLAAFADLEARLGPVELLVANSGLGISTYLEPFNAAEVYQMIQVNLLGVIHAIEAVLPGMLARRRGHLAAVSSLGAYKGLPGESGYCASKAAVNTYLEGLRIQLRGRGLYVTTICPGFIKTPMTAAHDWPMPWLLSAEEAARRIMRALERRKKVFNFPWQTTLLMKATRWLPDWVVARALHDITADKPPPA